MDPVGLWTSSLYSGPGPSLSGPRWAVDPTLTRVWDVAGAPTPVTADLTPWPVAPRSEAEAGELLLINGVHTLTCSRFPAGQSTPTSLGWVPSQDRTQV